VVTFLVPKTYLSKEIKNQLPHPRAYKRAQVRSYIHFLAGNPLQSWPHQQNMGTCQTLPILNRRAMEHFPVQNTTHHHTVLTHDTIGQRVASFLTDPGPRDTWPCWESCVKIYTPSCHLCKIFHQSPGCSATRWTAELHKLKESEGKEQLWQSLCRTVKVVKAGNGPAARSCYRWWLDICREFCRCLRSWDKGSERRCVWALLLHQAGWPNAAHGVKFHSCVFTLCWSWYHEIKLQFITPLSNKW